MAAPYLKTVDGFKSQSGAKYPALFHFFVILKDTLLAYRTSDSHPRVLNVSSPGHIAGEV